MEAIVKSRFTHWFESGRTFYSEKYGFKDQKSAEAALWRFASATPSAHKQQCQLWVVSLDLRSAYEKVWHSGLLVRWHEWESLIISFCGLLHFWTPEQQPRAWAMQRPWGA